MAVGRVSTYAFATRCMTWSNNTALARAGGSCNRKPPATMGMTSSVAAAAVRRRGIEAMTRWCYDKLGIRRRVGPALHEPLFRAHFARYVGRRFGHAIDAAVGVKHATALGTRVATGLEERIDLMGRGRSRRRERDHPAVPGRLAVRIGRSHPDHEDHHGRNHWVRRREVQQAPETPQ